MLGWTTIFALMFLFALLSTLVFDPSGEWLSLKIATVTSGTLLLACAITHVARGRV
jgi:hypothetical protein